MNEEHRRQTDRLLAEMENAHATATQRATEIEARLKKLDESLPPIEERRQSAERQLDEIESRYTATSQRINEAEARLQSVAGSLPRAEEHCHEAERLLSEIRKHHDAACQHAEETQTRLGYLASTAENEREKASRLLCEIEDEREAARQAVKEVQRRTTTLETRTPASQVSSTRTVETVRKTPDVPVTGAGVVERSPDDHPTRFVGLTDPKLAVEGQPRPDVPGMADHGNPPRVTDGTVEAEDAVASVELVPGEEKAAVKMSIRPESPRERLARYLHQAVSTRASSADSLKEMAGEVIDPNLAGVLRQHYELTVRQKDELERRLTELGGEAPAGKGVLDRVFGWFWERRGREPDDFDRTVQDLLEALAAQEFEAATSEALAGIATALEDPETAALASRHGEEKRSAVEQLRPFLTPLTGLAAHTTQVAQALRQPMVVEAEVMPVTPEGEPVQTETEAAAQKT